MRRFEITLDSEAAIAACFSSPTAKAPSPYPTDKNPVIDIVMGMDQLFPELAPDAPVTKEMLSKRIIDLTERLIEFEATSQAKAAYEYTHPRKGPYPSLVTDIPEVLIADYKDKAKELILRDSALLATEKITPSREETEPLQEMFIMVLDNAAFNHALSELAQSRAQDINQGVGELKVRLDGKVNLQAVTEIIESPEPTLSHDSGITLDRI